MPIAENKFLTFFVYQLFVSLSLDYTGEIRAYTGGEKVDQRLVSVFWVGEFWLIASPLFGVALSGF